MTDSPPRTDTTGGSHDLAQNRLGSPSDPTQSHVCFGVSNGQGVEYGHPHPPSVITVRHTMTIHGRDAAS